MNKIDENRTDNKSTKRATTKKSSAEKSEKKSEAKTGIRRVSTRRSSTTTKDDGLGDGVPISEKTKSTNKKPKKTEQPSLEISDSKSEKVTSSKSNNGRHSNKRAEELRPEYLSLKFSSVSKKLETSLIKFISENKETRHYLNLSFGSNSILRILDSKESEYFINLDDEYLMVNLKENSVKNYGDIFECGIDTMMNIPWSDFE
jgi:hypothetical protein